MRIVMLMLMMLMMMMMSVVCYQLVEYNILWCGPQTNRSFPLAKFQVRAPIMHPNGIISIWQTVVQLFSCSVVQLPSCPENHHIELVTSESEFEVVTKFIWSIWKCYKQHANQKRHWYSRWAHSTFTLTLTLTLTLVNHTHIRNLLTFSLGI